MESSSSDSDAVAAANWTLEWWSVRVAMYVWAIAELTSWLSPWEQRLGERARWVPDDAVEEAARIINGALSLGQLLPAVVWLLQQPTERADGLCTPKRKVGDLVGRT